MYTVVDGLGVRAAGNGLSYIVWLFIFEVVPIGGILLVYRRRAWFDETTAELSHRVRLSYHPLSQRYVVENLTTKSAPDVTFQIMLGARMH